MRLRNIQNGAIVKVIGQDDVRKTVKIEFEADGKTKDLSFTTIKRWWKEIKDDTVEDSKEEKPETSDTPAAEVSKKAAKPKAKKSEKATNAEVPGIADFIDGVAKKADMNFYIRDKQPNFKNYRFDDGKVLFTVRIVKHQVEINCKSRDIKNDVVSRMQKMNGFYDLKIGIQTLDDDTKKIISDIVANYKKEEK